MAPNFELNKIEYASFNDWFYNISREEQRNVYFKFIPTGIGYKVIVGIEDTDVKIDITDYEQW